jgi:hypothetical protein
MPGQAARLIGVLHVLNGVSSQPPEVQEEISLTTVRAGCHLAQFYLGQVTLLQGDGDALHGELTPVLKFLLEKVNELGSLTARQAQSAVWGLRSSSSDKIRQFFKELAAMDLADVQGAGSRLTLTSKVLRTGDEVLMKPQQHQQNQNPDNTGVLQKSNSKVLRTADEVLMNPQQAETFIYQEVQEINQSTADVFDAVQIFNTDTQPLNLEPDTDAVEVSVEESEISEKTSAPSALAKSEPETLIQQETKGAEESSALSSAVEESSALSSAVEESSALSLTKTNAGKKHRTFELGDRVVVKDVGGIYQGARGHVVDILESRAGSSYLVKFDKPIKNIPQIKVKASDLMKL